MVSLVSCLRLEEWVQSLVRVLRMDMGIEHLGVPWFLETMFLETVIKSLVLSD